MLTQKIIIPNKLGLHARASMRLIDCANRYQSEVHIRYKDHEVDAKDIMQIMQLAVTRDCEIELVIFERHLLPFIAGAQINRHNIFRDAICFAERNVWDLEVLRYSAK